MIYFHENNEKGKIIITFICDQNLTNYRFTARGYVLCNTPAKKSPTSLFEFS